MSYKTSNKQNWPHTSPLRKANMKLTAYSEYRIKHSAAQWSVDKEFFGPIYNYLVHGFNPGSFFTALLANDAMAAIQRSHPANTIPALKNLTGWIQDSAPKAAFGTYEKVDAWSRMTEEDRRIHLEDCRLIFSEREEIEMALRGKVAPPEPIMW